MAQACQQPDPAAKTLPVDWIEGARVDREAFAALYDAHYPRVFNYVMRTVLDVDAAEDIVSDTFLKALESACQTPSQGIGTGGNCHGETGEDQKTRKGVPPGLARMAYNEPSIVRQAKQDGGAASMGMGPTAPGTTGWGRG